MGIKDRLRKPEARYHEAPDHHSREALRLLSTDDLRALDEALRRSEDCASLEDLYSATRPNTTHRRALDAYFDALHKLHSEEDDGTKGPLTQARG